MVLAGRGFTKIGTPTRNVGCLDARPPFEGEGEARRPGLARERGPCFAVPAALGRLWKTTNGAAIGRLRCRLRPNERIAIRVSGEAGTEMLWVKPLAYLDALNTEQGDAVVHGISGHGANIAGPLLVIAGAGSGKTNTLAHRVAQLIVNGADPGRVLQLTFSRRAKAVTPHHTCARTGARPC